tara:strand:+ start:34734 stop:34967 length:234 start_codon:yes stop_codon:yes gene_type:complete
MTVINHFNIAILMAKADMLKEGATKKQDVTTGLDYLDACRNMGCKLTTEEFVSLQRQSQATAIEGPAVVRLYTRKVR